jgi:methylated-DNA-[protein]-cysteine S-methyltransferase
MSVHAPAYLGTVATPAGDATFAVNDAGSLVGLQFVEGHYPRTFSDALARDGYAPTTDAARTAAVHAAIEAYGQGTLQTFDLPVELDAGTRWQSVVWLALREIPFGSLCTYGTLAFTVGRPTAVRAVAKANATNRVPLVVPCHRVIGSNGTLTGFSGGLHLKARLIDHERRVLGMAEMWSAFHADTGA